MPEPGVFQRSQALLARSLSMLAAHKKLWLLPVASFVCALLTIALFAVIFFAPIALMPDTHGWFTLEHWEPLSRLTNIFSSTKNRINGRLTPHDFDLLFRHPINIARFAFCYFAMLATPLLSGLLNAAFQHEVMRALGGETVSLRRGLLTACRRFYPLLKWYVFSAVVVGLTRLALGRFGVAGRLAGSLLGVSWAVGSFFVIPVLLREKSSDDTPLKALRASAALIKRTWGESIAGFVSTQFFSLPALFGAAATYWLLRWADQPVLAALIAGGALVLWMQLTQAAKDTYRCALYIYATEGVIPDPFTEEQIDSAWQVK